MFIFTLDYFILGNEDFVLGNVESINTTKKQKISVEIKSI